MNAREIQDVRARMARKRAACPNVADKYRDAYRDGVDAALAAIDAAAGETRDETINRLRTLLRREPYPSREKTEAYHGAVRSAMSMLNAARGAERT